MKLEIDGIWASAKRILMRKANRERVLLYEEDHVTEHINKPVLESIAKYKPTVVSKCWNAIIYAWILSEK